MGCVMSAEEKAQQQMSRRIDDELAYEMAHRRSEVKLLLLGEKREGSAEALASCYSHTSTCANHCPASS